MQGERNHTGFLHFLYVHGMFSPEETVETTNIFVLSNIINLRAILANRDTRKIWFKTWEFYALKDTSRLLIIIKTKQQTISAIVTCNIAFRSLTDTWAMSWQADGSDFRTDICCTWQLQHGNIMTQVSHAELRMFDDAGYLIDLAVISPAVSTCEDNLKIMRGQEIFATAPY